METCELCNKGEATRDYEFGQMDATVTKFNCGHACCDNHADGFSTVSWHHNYAEAAGVARLIVAGEDAFANKYAMK